jgi:hypothetical protein
MFKATFFLVLGLYIFIICTPQLGKATQPRLVFTKGTQQNVPPDCFGHIAPKGEYLYSILQDLQVPDDQLGKGTRTVTGLNPHVNNPDVLHPGTRLYFPLALRGQDQDTGPDHDVHNQAKEMQSASSHAQLKNQLPETGPAEITPKRMVLNQLSKLDLNISGTGELLYPFAPGQWMRIDLDATPLADTPWGDTLLFVPPEYSAPGKSQAITDAGCILCPVPSDWAPAKVFAALETACPERFLAWSPGHPLILCLPQGHRLEIKVPTILAVRTPNKPKFFIFCSSLDPVQNLPGLLLGYLQENDIQLVTPEPDPGSTSIASKPNIPSKDNLFIPSVSWPDFVSMVRPAASNDSKSQHISNQIPAPTLLQSENLHLSWKESDNRSITLHLSLFTDQTSGKTIYFLSPNQANPYLVALLNLIGYTTYKMDF